MSRRSVILSDMSFDFHLIVICIYGVVIMVKGKACPVGPELATVGTRCRIVRRTEAAGEAGPTQGRTGAAVNPGVVDPVI